jgi:hypothetical protein
MVQSAIARMPVHFPAAGGGVGRKSGLCRGRLWRLNMRLAMGPAPQGGKPKRAARLQGPKGAGCGRRVSAWPRPPGGGRLPLSREPEPRARRPAAGQRLPWPARGEGANPTRPEPEAAPLGAPHGGLALVIKPRRGTPGACKLATYNLNHMLMGTGAGGLGPRPKETRARR